MKRIQMCLLALAILFGMALGGQNVQAQPVFDTPVTEFSMPVLTGPVQSPITGFPNTLQIGDLEPGFINPVTGDVLNDVVFVTNPLTINDATLAVRFFTAFHTSSEDTRALSLTTPTDLNYVDDVGHLGFELSSSVQILDLDGDGQNDLSFFGPDLIADFNDGPSPILGVMGTAANPFLTGNIDQIGTSIDQAPAASIFLSEYSGQPTLGVGDLDGDGALDLAFNDLELPAPAGAAGLVNGAGPVGSQRLHSLLNNGAFGPLPEVITSIMVPDPLLNDDAYGQYLVLADFDGNGSQDAGVVYMVDINDTPQAEMRVNVYPGNGDGSFNPVPSVNQVVASFDGTILDDPDVRPIAMTYGNFDGDGHLDMAVVYYNNANAGFFVDQEPTTAIVTCAPGTPPSCTVQYTSFDGTILPASIAAGDFDLDGLDDIVQLELACTAFMPNPGAVPGLINVNDQSIFGAGNNQVCTNIEGYAAVYLNQGGSITTSPDQTIIPTAPAGATYFPTQVVANDIDGCSPVDIAFTGTTISNNPAAGTGQGAAITFDEGIGVVAFASALAPLADAGTPIASGGGFQIGGDPTCSDTNGNPTSAEWTQISGTPATISDPTATNPTVSGLTDDSVFQVTCRTACGQATDTVTVPGGGGNFVEGSGCGSSLHGNLAGTMSQAYGWLLLGALSLGGLLRRRLS